MNILDSILSSVGLSRKSAAIPSALGGYGSADPFALFKTSNKIDAGKAMDVYNNWVYACIRAIAEEIGNAKFKLYKVGKDGKTEEIQEHDLLDLLEGVNDYQTGFELRYLAAAHLEMVGNAYWYLSGVKDTKGVPTAIYPLNPRYLKIKRGTIENPIEFFTYAPSNQKPQVLQPYEVLHLKYPDPNDTVEGIGTVQSIAQWIDADNYMTEFNRRFFLNGARIGGLLESSQSLNADQMAYLKRSFEDVFKGVDNAYKVAALPTGVKYTETGIAQKDMDFTAGSLAMRDRIIAGFRVPLSVLATGESETNRATAETSNYVFALRTIKPKLQLICSYLNEFLVPRYGADLYLDFENIVPEDRDAKIREMQAAVGSQPVASVNEARSNYLGLSPISNGDDVMTDFSKIPLGAPIKAASGIVVRSKAKRTTSFARNAKKRDELTEMVAKAAAEAVQNGLKEKNKSIVDMTDAEFEAVWKVFVTRVTPYETALHTAFEKYHAKQEKEVISNLDKITKALGKKKIKAINEDDLYELNDWVTNLVDAASPILTDLYGKEGAAAAKLLGRDDISVLTPETKKALEKSLELMSKTYNETTRSLLKQKLEKGLEDGLSQPDLKKLIQDVYEFSNASRALTVARTETFRVANSATHQAWKESGTVKTYRWYTAADERVCEFCDPMMSADPIGIDETFFGKGETVTGRDGGELSTDYSSIEYPPLHPQCRCYVRPDKIEI